MEIRLVAADMDGTFLTSERRPHPENMRAARELIQAGFTFCLASGRSIKTMRPLLAELGLQGPVVSTNGAYVLGPSGDLVQHRRLEPEILEFLIDHAEKHDLHTNHYDLDEIWFSKQGEFADLYAGRLGFYPVMKSLSDMRAAPATKLLYIAHPEVILEQDAILRPIMEAQGVSVVISEPDYIEFLPSGINKGEGLRALAESMGLQRENVAAIGDWLNDLEMIEWAGLGAAMENAHPDVKAAADWVVPTNDEAGVATFLSRILSEDQAGIVRS